MPRVWQIWASPAGNAMSVTNVLIWLMSAMRTGALRRSFLLSASSITLRALAMIAEIIEILADGLRRDFETPGKILHHHPALGAGDIEDLGLAVRKNGHNGALRNEGVPWCGGSAIRSTRQIGCGRHPMAERRI